MRSPVLCLCYKVDYHVLQATVSNLFSLVDFLGRLSANVHYLPLILGT